MPAHSSRPHASALGCARNRRLGRLRVGRRRRAAPEAHDADERNYGLEPLPRVAGRPPDGAPRVADEARAPLRLLEAYCVGPEVSESPLRGARRVESRPANSILRRSRGLRIISSCVAPPALASANNWDCSLALAPAPIFQPLVWGLSGSLLALRLLLRALPFCSPLFALLARLVRLPAARAPHRWATKRKGHCNDSAHRTFSNRRF